MSTGLDCIVDHLVPYLAHTENATHCDCQVFYEGSKCQTRLWWFDPLHAIRIGISLIIYVLIFYWGLVKLIYEIRQHGFQKKKLTHYALVLVLLGCIFTVTHRIFKAVHVRDAHFWYYSDYVFVIKVILTSMGISLKMAASMIIVSFWFALLTAKLRPEIGPRTQIASIVIAALVLVFGPVGTVLTQLNISALFLFMFLVPLLAADTLLIVMTSTIGCQLRTKLNDDHKMRHKAQYATKIFGFLSFLWVLHVVLLLIIAAAFLLLPRKVAMIEMFTGITGEFIEAAADLSILFLIDRKGGIKKLTRALCNGEALPNSESTSRGTSSQGTKSSSSSLDSKKHRRSLSMTATGSSQVSNASSNADSSFNYT